VAINRDGKTLVLGGYDGLVHLWDLPARRERAVLSGHQKGVLVAQFSPDGTVLATGGLDYAIKLWEMDRLVERATLLGHTGYVLSAAFTPDSKILATASGSRGPNLPGEVKLWDVATCHCRATLPGQTGTVAFFPDGRTLATVNDYVTVRLWQSTSANRSP
jgi:WD40 repeat protein